MSPSEFPEQNTTFSPPPGYDESQINYIDGYSGKVEGGNLDGMPVAVVAWKPSPEDLQRLLSGGVVYLGVCGGLVPHVLATDFETATLKNL